MTLPLWITLGVLFAAIALIASGRVRPELASLGACCVLLLSGVLAPGEVFPVFGNEAIITVGAMFVLSAALERTGVIDAASRLLQTLPIRSERGLLWLLLPPVLAVSAFANNTPVVVVFLPIVMTLAQRNRLAPSKLLIPLSFASILGGSCTLIGTSTNLVASAVGRGLGVAPIGMFEMTPAGLVLAGAGLCFLFVFAPRLLPRRETVTSLLDETSERQFIAEAFVPAASALIGRTALDALSGVLAKGRIHEIVRHGEVLTEDPDTQPLEAGDRLRVSVDAASVTAIRDRRGLRLHSAEAADLALGDTEETRVVECAVAPQSNLVGRTLGDADLPRRYGVLVLALHRSGVNLRAHLQSVVLRAGDVLLVEAGESELVRLRQHGELLVLAGGQRSVRWRRRWVAAALVAGVVGAAALQVMPVAVAALVGAVLAIATGCVDPEEAYHAVDWSTLFLIAGMLVVGVALERTRAIEFAARFIVGEVAPLGPWAVLSLLILTASVLTNFISNNAVAALLVPLAVETAHHLQVAPRAFVIGIAFGASACFATPIGYQTNTLVFNVGGYRFGDFLRLGLPMNLVLWVLASVLVPVFWPLH